MFEERMRVAYDRFAAEFARRNDSVPEAFVSIGGRFLSLAGTSPRILDAGCGPGRDMAWLESQGATVTGIASDRHELSHRDHLANRQRYQSVVGAVA